MADVLTDLLTVIVAILSNPALLLSLVTTVGLILLKKPVTVMVTGFAKTLVGYLALMTGIMTLVPPLLVLSDLFSKTFGITGYFPSVEAITGWAVTTYGAITGPAMVLAFGLSVLLARLTPLKYIYLSGHEWLYLLSILTMFIIPFGWDITTNIIVVGVLTALQVLLSSALSKPYHDQFKCGFVMGHGVVSGAALGAAIGALLGDPTKDAEDIELPESIMFLKEVTVSTALVVLVMFLLFAPFAGIDYLQGLAGADPWFLWVILQSATFTTGLAVLLFGLRMMLTELIPAFQGLAEKAIPGAMPALDCPAVFPFGEMSLMIGCLTHFVGQMICAAILIMLNIPLMPIAIPNILHAFFMGGTGSIWANKLGGYRGAIIAGLTHGVFYNLFASMCAPYVAGALGQALTLDHVDFSTMAMVWYGFIGITGGPAAVTPGLGWGMVLLILGLGSWIAIALLTKVAVNKRGKVKASFFVRKK